MSDESPRLMIVEDDDRFAETLSAEFRDRGYVVQRAASHSVTRVQQSLYKQRVTRRNNN